TNAQKSINVIDNAINKVNGQRGELGAINNRLEFSIDNLQSVSQQTSAARSRIVDADFAKESASLSRAQVLQQAGTAMLAQANSAPQQVLQLLQ
ncbi:MAG: flagellar biosynthesis protein FliC, partial [Methylococcales bacterium]|nr:flagellar biosynthesis protein FliC [Methylococcales bacterium]